MKRVAVFVDGENVSASHADEIEAHAGRLGTVQVMRVYGNVCVTPKWAQRPGFRHVHSGSGKNSADLLLCIDAMEFALTQDVDAFVLVSSDGDFTHLALRLRELGKHVTGVVEAKSPEAFRESCSEFRELTVNSTKATGPSPLPDLNQQIRRVIAANSQNGRGMPIKQLGTIMYQKHSIRISDHEEKTWRGYLTKRTSLFDLDPKGPDAMVRFKPEGF